MKLRLERYLITSFFLGFLVFFLEFSALRILSFFFGTSLSSTTLIITTFVMGMAFGTLGYMKNRKREFLALALFCISSAFISNLVKLYTYLGINFGLSAMIIALLPVFLSGAAINYIYSVKIYKNRSKVLPFIISNSLGGICGSISLLVFIRFFGIEMMISAISLILASYLVLKDAKAGALPFILITFLVLVPSTHIIEISKKVQIVEDTTGIEISTSLMDNYRNFESGRDYLDYLKDSSKEGGAGYKEVFTKDSPFGLVAVLDGPLMLVTHRQPQCAIGAEGPDNEIAVLSDELNPDAENALIAGLGCGFTLDTYLEKSGAKIEIVEINPVVYEAQRMFFKDGDNPVDDGRVRSITDDAYLYLKKNEAIYDTIIVTGSDPHSKESSLIYTSDFLQTAKSRLSDGGVLSFWSSTACPAGSDCDDPFDQIVYQTLRSVFPYVIRKDSSRGIVLLFASRKPIHLSLEQEEAELMQRYESLPFIVNSVTKPVILRFND
jgi:spermidine synthase